MEQDPNQLIELCGGGWTGPIARVRLCWQSLSRLYAPDGIQFTLVEIDALILHQAPAILVSQGMLLQDLFAPDTFFTHKTAGVLVRGPWVLLRGQLSERWAVPLRIDAVVLAALERVPENLTREQVLSALLQATT